MQNQKCSIPIFTPHDAQLFLKYFSAVDKILSQRFALGFQPHEDHLTSLLCELLDVKGSGLHQLEYNYFKLNEDLRKNGSLLTSFMQLVTTQHNRQQERFSQADLGIVVEYVDQVKPEREFKKGILLQAKKLFPAGTWKDKYDFNSKYESFNPRQHEDLLNLIDHIIASSKSTDTKSDYNCARYLLYNPAFSTFSETEQRKILYHQLSLEDKIVFSSSNSYQYPDILDVASLVVPLNKLLAPAQEAKTVGALIETVDVGRCSLPGFIVYDLILGDAGCHHPEWLKVVQGNRLDSTTQFGTLSPKYVLYIRLAVSIDE